MDAVETSLCAIHLTFAGLMTQLSNELHLLVETGHVRLREHPAARVARKLATKLDPAILNEIQAFALLAKTEALERGRHHEAVAVVTPNDVHISWRSLRHCIATLG